MPSSSRSVSVTAFAAPLGLTMATPMFRLRFGMISTNMEASVVIGSGTIPACDRTEPRYTVPNVTVGVGAPELASGVMIM